MQSYWGCQLDTDQEEMAAIPVERAAILEEIAAILQEMTVRKSLLPSSSSSSSWHRHHS